MEFSWFSFSRRRQIHSIRGIAFFAVHPNVYAVRQLFGIQHIYPEIERFYVCIKWNVL